MKKAYTSPLLDQHKYVQELDTTLNGVTTASMDNDVELDFD